MACIISTAKGQSLSQEMKNMFPGVRSEIFSSIINYSGTLITDNPLTGQDSSLYSECLNLTNNPELAVQMAASAYTQSFINSYGDWINGENKGLLLNKDGMPKLAYKTIDGVSTNYFQALGQQLNQKLKSIGQYNRYKNLVDTFVNQLTKYNTSEESYYSFIKDYTGSLLEVISTFNSLGIFDSLDPIEVGFVSTNTPYSGQLLTENYNFYKLATSKDSYYKQILETISREGGIYRNSIIPYNNPRIGDKYLKIIDVNNGIIQIKEGITLQSLENSRSYPSKGIANVLKLKFPEFYQLYATDNIRFGGFMRGIANILLDDYHHKQNTSLNIIVQRAIKFESNLHGGLSSFILNNKINPKIEQLTLFAEVPTRTNTTNSARIQNLIQSVEDPTDVDQLLTYIANTDQYFSEIAQHLIGKVKVNIRFEEDNWRVLDPATQQIRETDGSYDPQSNTITLSKNMYGYPPAVLIHEVIHAATYISLHNNDAFSKKAELILNEARKLIFQKYNVQSIEELNKVSHFLAYGLSNTDEFFSMLWTNSSFIRELNSVGPKQSLWSKIKNFLLDILGIKQASKLYVDASTLLDQILSTRNQYTEEELASYREALPIELFDVGSTLFEDPVEIRSITPQITLTQEQQKAVSDIYNIYVSDRMNKTHSICRITGLAGTGKTTVCPEIVKTIKEQDNKAVVYVAALTNEAKNNIASKFDKGLKVKDFTIAQLTGKSRTINSAGFESWKIDEAKRVKIEAQASKVQLLIIDEASMLTTEMMEDLESLYSNATIIYIGDNGQLRPISDSEKNPNTPFMQKDLKDLAYSIEFIQTMRQEEDAPILGVAQQFGNISRNIGIDDESAKIQMREAWAALSKIQTTITERSAVFTVNTANKEAIVDQLIPLIFEAIQEGNTNKVGIIPYFNENGTAARTIYNNLIRKKILESKGYVNISLNAADDNYVGNIPYQVGEIITLDSPYRNIVDTGQKLIISQEAEPYNLVNPIDGDDPIFTYRYTARYISGNVEKTISMIILPEKSKSKYKDVLDQLRKNAYWEEGLSREQKQIAINQFMGFSMAVANANPSWALNVHKAQGQTYEVIYVPLDDYTYPYNQKWQQSSLPPRLKTAQFSSQIYTAITRASNITILGYGTYRDNNFGVDLLELNSQLNGNKLSQRDIVKTEIEQPADKPEIQPQITSSNKFLKYRKLYDFLQFATGSNQAFKDLQSGNKDIADRYIKLFFQRESELVKYNRTFGIVPFINGVYDFKSTIQDPRILEEILTEDRIKELEDKGIKFKPLKNVIIKSAQAVVPKQYAETFKLGSHSLAEITPNFFKNINCFYWSKVKNTDMLVRTHAGSFNIAYQESEEFGEINNNIRKDALGYRLDKDGNRMYQLPQGAIVYTRTGSDGKIYDTIVLKSTDHYKETKFILRSISDDIVSIQPFLTNIRSLDEAKKLITLTQNYSVFQIEAAFEVPGLTIISNKAQSITELQNGLYDYYKKHASVYRQKLANTLYNSFVKACSITSSRIPTQALASFMDMSVVSYNPYGSNDIFVSRWQLWLQGSDLDINLLIINQL